MDQAQRNIVSTVGIQKFRLRRPSLPRRSSPCTRTVHQNHDMVALVPLRTLIPSTDQSRLSVGSKEVIGV